MAKAATAEAQVGQVTDQNPIINDPYVEPTRHWQFGDGAPVIRDGRRVAGYIPPMVKGGQLQITDELVPLEQVNRIRDRVREWREDGYPGATGHQGALRALVRPRARAAPVLRPAGGDRDDRLPHRGAGRPTRRDRRHPLRGLRALGDQARDRRRQDAGDGDDDRLVGAEQGRQPPGPPLRRRVPRRRPEPHRQGAADGRRRSAALRPEQRLRRFELIPGHFAGLLGQVKVLVTNWHQLAPKEDPKRSVLRRGRESDAAFARRVLADLGRRSGSWC